MNALPELANDSKKILDLLTPVGASSGKVSSTVKALKIPGTTESKRLDMLAKAYQLYREPIGSDNYIDCESETFGGHRRRFLETRWNNIQSQPRPSTLEDATLRETEPRCPESAGLSGRQLSFTVPQLAYKGWRACRWKQWSYATDSGLGNGATDSVCDHFAIDRRTCSQFRSRKHHPRSLLCR